MQKKILLVFLLVLFLCGQAWADVDTLRPTGDRAYTAWTDYPEAGDDYDKIDEVTSDGDATYLWTKNTSFLQGWSHTDWTTSDNIDSVRLTIKAKSAATTGTPEIVLARFFYYDLNWSYCNNRDTVSLTTDYEDYSITWTQDPCDAASWNISRLNNTSRAWGWENYSVGTAPDSFGNTTADTDFPMTTGYCVLYRYQSDFGGKVESLSVYFTGEPDGDCKMGIYSDSGASGYPYERLDTTAEFSLSSGWNTATLVNGDVSVAENSYYWIAFRVSTTFDSTKRETGPASNCGRYKSYPYASAWPDPIPSDYSGEQISYRLEAIGNETQDNRVTQSFVEVFYQEAAPPEGQVIIVH